MRVTQKQMISEAIRNVQTSQERLQLLQRQASSGKRLHLPEDDPLATERVMSIRSHLHRISASRRNLDMTRDWLSASERALRDLQDALGRARVLALRGANDTLSANERLKLATEADELVKQAVQIGNTTHRGLHLFSGHKTQTSPFTLDAGPPETITYNGDSGEILHEIEPGTVQSINIAGDDVTFTDAFAALQELRDALVAGDGTATRNSIDTIDTAVDSGLGSVATLGSRQRGLNATGSRLTELETDLQSLLSRTQDADMAETIMQLNMEDLAYRSTLAATSRMLPMSLLDYLI